MTTEATTEAKWSDLLTDSRIGKEPVEGEIAPPGSTARSEFDRDYDRIIFSSAFRRLADKTQVFPLSQNDYVRTRLTHSLEVSSVGQSLGRIAGESISSQISPRTNDDLGRIVAAACLAHDIGNPPFGHSGESAIQEWAEAKREKSPTLMSTAEWEDICQFEGNAQAIRVLCRLQHRHRAGGLQLTAATLGAMMKYPCSSTLDGNNRDRTLLAQKKFGYFHDDSSLIVPALRKEMKLLESPPGAFQRHPLALLTEAADDICYAIVDLEDSVDQGVISADRASTLLEPIAAVKEDKDPTYVLKGKDRVQWLRAHAINALIGQCAVEFVKSLPSIMAGSYNSSLIQQTTSWTHYEDLQREVKEYAYRDPRVLAIELAGYRVIQGLLDLFVDAFFDPKVGRSKKLISLFPSSYLGDTSTESKEKLIANLSSYQKVLAAADYISGMTDRYALKVYRELSGISLPA
jgi:dGTPase